MESRTIQVAVALVLATSALVHGQGRGPTPAPAPPAAGRGAAPAYPPRPPVDAAILARGKAAYSVNCQFCHGTDARGGDGGGPNLLRSQLVLSDQRGELIGEVVRNGRPGTAMAAMPLSAAQISDIADYVHSFRVDGNESARNLPASILVGDAKAGAAAFQSRCASCHSVTADLKGIATRAPDARQLQDLWLMPPPVGARGAGRGSARRPITVAVTLPSGQMFEGPLIRVDDFVVTLQQADGMPRSFSRSGNTPKVEIKDPLAPHRDLLPKYTDTEIHDITAYLVTVK